MKELKILLTIVAASLSAMLLPGLQNAEAQVPNAASLWRGEYFNDMDLSSSPAVVREDRVINFSWGHGSPDARIRPDHFSVRWTRRIYFLEGNYLFVTLTDDGVRLWVDDKLIIDEWRDMPPTRNQATVYLSQGDHLVRLEYYENEGRATAWLWWKITANNLAMGKNAVASSAAFVGVGPRRAVDGDRGTQWSSPSSDPQWIYVDLDDVYVINQIILRWRTAYARRYGIYIWRDGHWESLYWTEDGDGDVDVISFDSTMGRYIMMGGVESGTPWGYSLREFEIYGSGVASSKVGE